jgi:tetratricopeptide (TPR) repeat protein
MGDVAVGQGLVLVRPVWVNSSAQARPWLERALETVDAKTPPRVAIGLHLKQAALLTEAGDYEDGARAGGRAAEICRASGESGLLAPALHVSGTALLFAGRVADGATLLQQAVDAARGAGDRVTGGFAMLALAQAHSAAGDFVAEGQVLRAALLEFDDPARSSVAANFWRMAVAQEEAEHAFAVDDPERAYERASEAIEIQRTLKHRGLAATLVNASAYLVALDRYEEARALACEALALVADEPVGLVATYAILRLASVAAFSATAGAAGDGDRARGARLLGFAQAWFARRKAFLWNTNRRAIERLRAFLGGTFGAAELEQLLAEGAALDRDAAVEEAGR